MRACTVIETSLCEASHVDSRDWVQRSKPHAKAMRCDISIQKGPLRLRDLFLSKEPSSRTQLLNALREVLQITNYLMHLNMFYIPWKNDAVALLPFNQPFCSIDYTQCNIF